MRNLRAYRYWAVWIVVAFLAGFGARSFQSARKHEVKLTKPSALKSRHLNQLA